MAGMTRRERAPGRCAPESRDGSSALLRGVGTDWEVAQLREIASELLGTVDIIPEPDTMPEEFRALIAQAITKRVADLSLEIWTPEGAPVSNLSQVAPSIEDLTRIRRRSTSHRRYPTRAGATESVTITSASRCLSRTRRRDAGGTAAARRQRRGRRAVTPRAVWTEDPALSTKLNREVAHYTGQVELAQAIQDGLAANSTGDFDTATARLGRAYQLAAASGNDATLKLLGRLVEVEDARQPERFGCAMMPNSSIGDDRHAIDEDCPSAQAGRDVIMASDDDPTPRDGTELVTRDSAASEQSCLVCGSPRTGSDRYCESDGYDFESRSRWIAVAAADRAYFEQVASEGIAFPCLPSAHLSARRGRGEHRPAQRDARHQPRHRSRGHTGRSRYLALPRAVDPPRRRVLCGRRCGIDERHRRERRGLVRSGRRSTADGR